MKIDFHTHGKLSKKVSYSAEFFISMIKAAQEEGLTALTLTEHFNTLRFFELYEALDKQYEYKHDYYDIDGFQVFPGMEVDVREGGHILVVGKRQSILSIREQLTGYEEKENFISVVKLFELCAPHNMLLIGAHPFRPSNPLHHLPRKILSQLDCLDLNGKDLCHTGIETTERQVYQLAKQIGISVVGGSDSHYPLQLGSVLNIFEEKCQTIAELKEAIGAKKYQISISPRLENKVHSAETMKKNLIAKLI